MGLIYSPYSIIMLVNGVLAAIGGGLTLRRREKPGVIFLAWMLLAVMEWSLGLAGEYAANDIPTKILLAKLEYLGESTAAPLFFMFALEYTRQGSWLTKGRRIALWVVPALTVIMVAFNEFHFLHWTSFTPGEHNILIFGHGPWFYVFMAYSYLLAGAGSFILIQSVARYPLHYRNQMIALIIAAIIPLVSTVLLAFIPGFNTGLNFFPISLTLTGLIIGIGIWWFESFDLVPIARDTLIENISDGVLVLDTLNRIVDINPAAQQLLGLEPAVIGQNVSRTLPMLADLVSRQGDTIPQRREVYTISGEVRHLDIRITPLYDRAAQVIGHVITLRDITLQKFTEDKLERYASQMMTLYDTTLQINSQTDPSRLLQTIVERAARLVGTTAGGLYLIRTDGQSLELAISHNLGNDYTGTIIRFGEGLAGRVAQSGQIMTVEDYSHWQDRASVYTNLQAARVLAVPLKTGGRMIGVIDLVDNKKVAPFSDEEVRLASLFADQAVIAIEKARLYSEVQHLAIVDELTGMYNYRGLVEHGSREVERARRFHRSLSALFFDLDGFREFNNRYSHATGNLILQAVARGCRSWLRSVDVLARYGGDEFVVLLPETCLRDARQTANRLCQEIASQRTETAHGKLGVTLSIGVAEYQADMADVLALIDRANRAEHIAKQKGNCVVVLEDQPSEMA